MADRALRVVVLVLVWLTAAPAVSLAGPPPPASATVLWYTHPAEKWENALPVGNGRLGAMVFGRADEEIIQLNEDTYWSGGPYSTTVAGGYKALPEIRRLLFDGQLIQAHRLFGRHLMGYPVEQQKYQSLGNLVLTFPAGGAQTGYRHELDLDTAVATTTYERDGTRYRREVFSSPVDQVIVVRLTAEPPGRLSFTAQLRGDRNQAHSNYATDYFRMDADGPDGLVVRGKSADYLGVAGRLRYTVRLRALADGGRIGVEDDRLVVREAASVTLLVAAATSFVNYKDVSGDPDARVEAALRAASVKTYADLKAAHAAEHQRLFRRVRIDLGASPDSALPTDERLKKFDGANDPALAALLFQFGRYVLISLVACGHAAGQPAGNLEQGHESHVGFEVHDQHQHGDELLAGRGRQPRRVCRSALPDDPGADRSGLGRRAGALRRARVGVPSEHRHLARGRPDGRAELGRVRHRRRVADHSPLGALPVHGRQGVPRGVLPRDEGRGRVPAGFPGASSEVRVARHEPVHLSRELPARARATTASSTK